jgi:hypothetical protein
MSSTRQRKQKFTIGGLKDSQDTLTEDVVEIKSNRFGNGVSINSRPIRKTEKNSKNSLDLKSQK